MTVAVGIFGGGIAVIINTAIQLLLGKMDFYKNPIILYIHIIISVFASIIIALVCISDVKDDSYLNYIVGVLYFAYAIFSYKYPKSKSMEIQAIN